ncbi:lipopolysaccharide biosynthesis protein [Plantibacter sp. VKM Ac-2885]|uniref:lipopolysaccharide biosynthesis protein n=1 Tax=Plantibacter sp. VKM Ac-2885 TaxID=2783828 RepID=UPI00188AD80A|nr:lipopolysaccharide biosynthesis protein [Plantibacter sp. VKM Ac-2885]MBF4513969.1 lipopolysaccharide biosynthesis protein [Plantibacter sp. VKM Ac-2885]
MTQGESDGLRKKATQSIGWIILERWSSRVLTLTVIAVLTRLLSPADFGLVSMATVVIAILQVFVESGFVTVLVQKKELGEKDTSTAFWTSVTLSIILYVALFFTAPLLAGLFGEPQLVDVLRVLGLSLPVSSLAQVPAALLERSFGFKSLAIRQVGGALCGAAVAVVIAFSGGGVWALVAQTLVTSAASVVILWTATPWRPSLEFSFSSLRSMWSMGLRIIGIGLLDAVQQNIDKLIVGAFFSTEVLGYYYLAQRIGTILIELVTTVMSRVTLTTFSKVQDDLPRLNRIFLQMTFASAAIGVPIFGLVAVFAVQIVPFAFGPGWEDTAPLMWILACGWAFGAVMYFDRSAFLSIGRADVALWVAILQNIVGVALVFALLPLGIVGVALSRWSRIVTWPVRIRVLHRLIGLPVGKYLAQVFRCVAAMVPVVIAVTLLQQTAWARTDHAFWAFAVPLGLLGSLIYAVLVWWFAGPENRTVLRQIFGPIMKRILHRLRPAT